MQISVPCSCKHACVHRHREECSYLLLADIWAEMSMPAVEGGRPAPCLL
jgi:hypothetical protein